MTFDALSRSYIYPLVKFVASVTGQTSKDFDVSLGGFNEPIQTAIAKYVPVRVDPWNETKDAYDGERRPFIRETDPFFTTVMAGWLKLSEKLINPIVVSAPRFNSGFLENETFSAVGAMEQVQRELMTTLSTPFADSLRVRLAAHASLLGLSSEDRRRIINTVKQSEFTLQQRLELLLTSAGEEFFQWFLGGRVRDWSVVTASVRNAIGHGLQTPERRPENYELLVDVERTARSIVTFRLLIECGFPEGELLERVRHDEHWNWLAERSERWPAYLKHIRS